MFLRIVLKLQPRYLEGRKEKTTQPRRPINLALMLEANQPFAVVFDRGASLS